MNHTHFHISATIGMALSIAFATVSVAGNCYPPLGGSPENVAWTWGSNYNGELGDGTNNERDIPVQVQNLRGLQTIAAGGGHNLALMIDGTVRAWGWNLDGQLGDGSTVDRHTPVQVSNLSQVKCIAGGYEHSLALKNDGTVWAWGWNGFGQLGDGTTTDRHTPVQVPNLNGVTAIAAGSNVSLAVKTDGTLWAWGQNTNGALGDGTTIDRHSPVQVPNLSGVTGMATAAYHSLAVKNDGTVWAWGANGNGELGIGNNIEHHTPVQVRDAIVLAPPDLTARIIRPPFPPPGYLTQVKAVAAGTGFSLALKIDGTVRAWGFNFFGQLGDATNISRDMPVAVPHVSGVIGIAAGSGHSLAFRSGAIVQDWGWNTNGQLGDNTKIDHPFAVQVENLVENLRAVMAVDGGVAHSIAAGPSLTLLTVRKFLMHPDPNRLRLFNLTIDGVVVGANINSGSTRPQMVSPGAHMVGETGTPSTPLSAFETIIGGDCATNGAVNLAPGDRKICTITNYDHAGGCPTGSFCCAPGEGTQGCQSCIASGLSCP